MFNYSHQTNEQEKNQRQRIIKQIKHPRPAVHFHSPTNKSTKDLAISRRQLR